MNNNSPYVKSDIYPQEYLYWDLFAPYALFKEEYIDEESEKEIIFSYVNAEIFCAMRLKSRIIAEREYWLL